MKNSGKGQLDIGIAQDAKNVAVCRDVGFGDHRAVQQKGLDGGLLTVHGSDVHVPSEGRHAVLHLLCVFFGPVEGAHVISMPSQPVDQPFNVPR